MTFNENPLRELPQEAYDFIDLFKSLGERAETFLPKHIFDSLSNFVKLCYDEPVDLARNEAAIGKYIQQFKENIPGYISVSLMLHPHEDSKAFRFNSARRVFVDNVNKILDQELVSVKKSNKLKNIKTIPDYSVGTPPVTAYHINFMSKILLGDSTKNLRKFRDVIGINEDIDEAHWNYFMDALNQLIHQSLHYTTAAEKKDFLHRTEWTVNFKGLNGLIRTVVSGNSDTAVELISEEVFTKHSVKVVDYSGDMNEDHLLEMMQEDSSSVFIVKVKHMRKSLLAARKWYPYLTRLIIVDDSNESRRSNTSLVFCLHNKVINTLNKAHTKKLGAPANTQLNIRLVLENVNHIYLDEFKVKIEKKIDSYKKELDELKKSKLGNSKDKNRIIALYRLDEFTRQLLKDKYTLEKFVDFLNFLESTRDVSDLHNQAKEMVKEFEDRMASYFYSKNPALEMVTITEGGGRNQIRSYGKWLLHRSINGVSEKVAHKCKVISKVLPSNYKRTLHNHFHKNFGINLFLEKYQDYLKKRDNISDSVGRFKNLIIDLGVEHEYNLLKSGEKEIVREFFSNLSNSEKTSIADDVQMIIRDLLMSHNEKPKPYIIYNENLAWEYTDLFPEDRFDINPFDLQTPLQKSGRIDYDRLIRKLNRIKASLQLFDDSGNLWDAFCDNTTIIINDPSNPSGFSDFNTEPLIRFLQFLNQTKITLLLDEAYNDSVKVKDSNEPKWRTISRYIFNNIGNLGQISAVSSVSTTKNLGATGDRLGAMAATPARHDFVRYIRQSNRSYTGNTCSLYLINNSLKIAQQAKRVKDRLDCELPTDASRQKIRKTILQFLIDEEALCIKDKCIAGFEGSPLHLFLLDELLHLDQLDVLGIPDDFKYRGKPYFAYYQSRVSSGLSYYRMNRLFRSEANNRLNRIKKIAAQIIEKEESNGFEVVPSDGSYLFNISLTNLDSFTDLNYFCIALARYRGIAVLPYPTGMVRFSLGGYIQGSTKSYDYYDQDFANSLHLFIDYWEQFQELRNKEDNKERESVELLEQLFGFENPRHFVRQLIKDYKSIVYNVKDEEPSLKINNIRALYHASPKASGVSINAVQDSKNSVFEFQGNIGECANIEEFINSRAFTKIYEHLLAHVYKRIPQLRNVDFNKIAARYSKATLLKYIQNKKNFQPNHYILDNPEEYHTMREILIEMEDLLFSPSRMKILAIPASGNIQDDKVKLEGVNRILKKYIQEIMLHFDLPFDQELREPSREEIITTAIQKFQEVTGIPIETLNLRNYIYRYVYKIRSVEGFPNDEFAEQNTGYLTDVITRRIVDVDLPISDKLLYLYLMRNDDSFAMMVIHRLNFLREQIDEYHNEDAKIHAEKVLSHLVPEDLGNIIDFILRKKDIKVPEEDLHKVTQRVVLFLISILNRTKGTSYYDRYVHTLIKVVENKFIRQNSNINQMIQHGVSVFKNFADGNTSLEQWNKGQLKWISDILSKCGVISAEQSVQTHTRIATDAKKREHPFHKVDLIPAEKPSEEKHPDDYLKYLDVKPASSFFVNRLVDFTKHMDNDDYRCKIMRNGLVKELMIFQKSYIKYLTDNFRLMQNEDASLEDIKDFVPDTIMFYGAPEKVISFPKIGYFDIPGPNGNIKTIVTPLRNDIDYFGDIKKPRLQMMNERVKEMGGIPKHGSLFAVELEDGGVFVVEVDGDSGVGKSEMIAALVLKWLRHNLPGIRSVKLIAGDMFHVFQDEQGQLYGIGTEVGDFSRVTDFDPDYIRYYRYLFESSADSNVEDLNSRSTVSGLCDITMPYKIDIMLTASNYAQREAGITRVDNPENFLLYIDSHGERKEKATSQDGPNFQRTLLRYTHLRNIVDVLSTHGNYLDTVLDWVKDKDGIYYLASSYKMMDKVDIEEVVNQIFVGKDFIRKGVCGNLQKVRFDVILNRFICSANDAEGNPLPDFILDRPFFSSLYDSLASTPAGQPFIAEELQMENRLHLLNALKGGKDGKGKGKNVQCGILSTEIGKKGREISGPRKAAEHMSRLIQEVRNANPEFNKSKNAVKNIILKQYPYIFETDVTSNEVWRYNFYLYQHHKMRQATFRRMDFPEQVVDLSHMNGFIAIPKDHGFSPLLITPNLNIELNSFSETYLELMSLPNYPEFAQEFEADTDKLYVAKGYSQETIVNNMIIQLLLLNEYISIEDLPVGRVAEMVNRETIAAAKYAVMQFLNHREKSKVETPEKVDKKPSNKKK
ncbi:MAG: aminotransferase class I/II-fold pyridoxal phosphate-dependent enzyme [Bacteroidales bacterium]